MSKKSTLLTCLAALLVLSSTAFATKAGAQPGEYDVWVDGDVSPDNPLVYPYYGEDGGGRSKPVNVSFQDLDLDLSYFEDALSGGASCFGDAHAGDLGTPMILSEERDESAPALVRYWFRGFGTGYPDDTREIAYQLAMSGAFNGPWRPESGGTSTALALTGWEMRIEGKKHKRIACTGDGSFPNGVTVTVLRTN
ncbi:MAG: hypothetical protein OEM62_05935 [Acidobacteriota bacterium]|nr:hypothetical protein [Acidobacteriota bacterium]